MIYDPSLLISGDCIRDRFETLLHDVLNLDQNVIECLSTRGTGEIFDNELKTVIGHMIMVDDALPVVGFTHAKFARYQKQQRKGNEPRFVPRVYHRDRVGIMVDGPDAPPEFHSWLHQTLFTQWMDRPGYKISRRSVPFFQGGAHEPNGKWFFIEFMSRRGIYETTAWINEHFRYPEA